MTWRLKNKELQKKLDELSDGDFSEALAEGRFQSVSSPVDPNIKWRVYFGDVPDFLSNRFSVCFTNDEVEEVPEYKADGWNHWPETEPEECVLMEIREDGDDENHGFNFFLDGIWYHSMGYACSELSNKEFRYRPAKLFFEERRRNRVN